MPPSPSRVGRYVIVERLGKGGMGVVHRAWDPHLQRMVAVKMLTSPPDGPEHAELLQRFAREAQSAAALSHPHIVTVYDVGQHAGSPYITMELLDGESLAELVDRRAELRLETKLRLALELCEGLSFAHANGIIHRDVKPANLMVTSKGALKILDFGLARIAGEIAQLGLTRTGAIMGTLNYMAPEQASGRLADERSDVFSLGAVLYELFSYARAFDSDTPSGVLYQVLHHSPPAMRVAQPEIPPGLDEVVARALEKDPARRYSTVDELARDLRAIAAPPAERKGAAGAAVWPAEGDRDVTSPPTSGFNDALDQWGAMVGRALAETEANRSEDATGLSAVRTPRRAFTLEIIAVAVVVAALGAFFAWNGRDEGVAGTSPAAPRSSGPVLTRESGEPARGVVEPRTEQAPSKRVSPTRDVQTGRAGTSGRSGGAELVRCTDLLERVGLGEDISAADRAFLTERCRNGGR